MSDVKWIKLATDIFNNRKIKQIMKMPEGDAIVVMWVQILCLAGTINNNGVMILTRDIPYTEETLATEFDRPVQLVRLALQTFCLMGMLELHDNIYMVTNWERYQNNDRMQEIKQKNRERQARFKERHALELGDGKNNVKVTLPLTLPVTPSNALDIDIRDKNKSKRKNKEIETDKKPYGEFQNVYLTDDEYQKLYVKREEFIERLSAYKSSSGKRYKNDYATILTWMQKDGIRNIKPLPKLEIEEPPRNPELEERMRNLVNQF